MTSVQPQLSYTPTQLRLHQERAARLARLGMGSKPPLRFVMHEVKSAPHARRERVVEPPVQISPVAGAAYNRPYAPAWKEIVAQSLDAHRLPRRALEHKNRDSAVVAARHEVCFRLRNELFMSWPEVARRAGLTNHTSAIHGARKHQRTATGTGTTFRSLGDILGGMDL